MLFKVNLLPFWLRGYLVLKNTQNRGKNWVSIHARTGSVSTFHGSMATVVTSNRRYYPPRQNDSK
jgi:hypothetical protein